MVTKWKELHDAGYAAAEEGELKKAVDFLKKAVKEAETNEGKEELCQSLNCVAVVYQALGKDADAKKNFEKTISLRPDTIELPSAIEALGDLYAYDNDEKALELYDEALKEYARIGEHDALLDAQNKILAILSFADDLSVLKERKISKAEDESLKRNAEIGKTLLKLAKKSNVEPSEIVQRIDTYIDSWQDSEIDTAKHNPIEVSKGLGALWGNQLVDAFEWSWVCLEGAGNLHAVVSPDRALIINPVYFVRSCLEMAELDCTIMLAFNMLTEGQFEEIEPGSYENVMEGVHRVIPKPGRSLSMAAGRLPD